MDWTVKKGSRIARLPGVVRPIALLLRNAYTSLPTNYNRFPHRHDGVATRNNDSFRKTPEFSRAYARAVQAGGWDYQIPYRIHQALWCSRQAQKVEGDFVELGTARGFIMSAVLTAYESWETDTRSLHLFDTFLSTQVDYDSGKQSKDGAALPTYAVSAEAVRENFSEWPRVHLHQGDVLETLPAAALGQVAFLHIDLNYHVPETFGLRRLWPQIPRGGVVLLDDYAHCQHVPQYEAMNALAKEIGFDILSTPSGQGIIIK